jgi:hypothetical protein
MVFMGKSLSFASTFVACDHIRNGVHDWAHYLSARMHLVVTMEKQEHHWMLLPGKCRNAQDTLGERE